MRTDQDASDEELDMSVKRTLDNMKNGDCDIKDSEGSESSGDQSGSPDEDKRVARIIGELPIAEYEGSPRRYGTQKSARSPRPGFPQVPTKYLYSFRTPTSSQAYNLLLVTHVTSSSEPVGERILRATQRGTCATVHSLASERSRTSC